MKDVYISNMELYLPPSCLVTRSYSLAYKMVYLFTTSVATYILGLLHFFHLGSYLYVVRPSPMSLADSIFDLREDI